MNTRRPLAAAAVAACCAGAGADPVNFVDPGGQQNSTGAACSFDCDNGMGSIGVGPVILSTEGSTGSGLASAGASWQATMTFPVAQPVRGGERAGEIPVAVITLTGTAFADAFCDPSAPFADANWSADINFNLAADAQFTIVIDDRVVTTGDPDSYSISISLNPDGSGSGLISTGTFASYELQPGENFGGESQAMDWNGTTITFFSPAGACYFGSDFASCADGVLEADCVSGGGVYLGDGSGCADGADLPNELVNFAGGSILATQTIATGYGDDTDPDPTSGGGSELDQLIFADAGNGDSLVLAITGNLESSFQNLFGNGFVIFLDSERGGENTLGAYPGAGFGGARFVAGLAGTTFDPGFEPDHAIVVNASGTLDSYFVDHVTLRNRYSRFVGQGDLTEPTLFFDVLNRTGWSVAFDNSNTAGVAGDPAGPPDPNAATATEGLQLLLDRADLGIAPGETFRAMVVLSSGGNPSFVSNHTLPPLPDNTPNLMFAPIDFASLSGQQHASAQMDGPRPADLDGTGELDFFDAADYFGSFNPSDRNAIVQFLTDLAESTTRREPQFAVDTALFAGELNGGPYFHVPVDLDVDGVSEVLTTEFGDDEVRWAARDAPNSAAFATVGAADGAMGPAAADLDGDGNTDVIAGSFFTGEVYWWAGDGAFPPTFGARQTAASGIGAPIRSVAIDIDADGDADIVTISESQDRVVLLHSDGMDPPNFTAIQVSTGVERPRDLVVADIDGDGDLDLAVASGDDDQVSWHESDGANPPSFTRHPLTIDPDGAGPLQGETQFATAVVAEDLDLDGDIDLAAASNQDGRVTIFLNDGDPEPSFFRSVVTDGQVNLQNLECGDINMDGFPDLVAFVRGQDGVVFFENNGAPVPFFKEFPTWFVGNSSANAGLVADIDGDGIPEMVTNFNSDLAVIYTDVGLNDAFPLPSAAPAP